MGSYFIHFSTVKTLSGLFHVNSKTYLALRYLPQEKNKKGVFSLIKIGLGPAKSVHLVSLREMSGQNLIVPY